MAGNNGDRGLFKRGKRWYLRAYVDGQGRRVFALKPQGATHATRDKGTARVLARQLRRRLKEGQVAQQPTDLPTLLKEFGEVAALRAAGKQARHSVHVVERFLAAQQVRSPSEITAAKIESYLAALRAAGRQPSTIWNHRSGLSRFCEFLRGRGLVDGNPARETRPARIEKSLPVFLSPEQAEQALEIARAHGLYAEVGTALYTGLRRSELRRLEWGHVDFQARVLLVPRSKSHRPRTVPLSRQAVEILREQREKTGDRKYAFPGRERCDQSGMRRMSWWAVALQPIQAAVPVFQERNGRSVGRGWHLLRHTFASWLAQRGVSLFKIGEWLGHADARATQIYTHLQPHYDPDIEHLDGSRP